MINGIDFFLFNYDVLESYCNFISNDCKNEILNSSAFSINKLFMIYGNINHILKLYFRLRTTFLKIYKIINIILIF
ncbi:hypothetical protein PNEG_04285 [Pneumocystis murina B123]|uniref:Uncharacterized protein n=1 Tax=Pneumocystis murina (strain B123) TaxID=1069680 RepID=A0A0W4ZX22_PNEMU|nr:hypothetical protein PNEG_04285 [Pneumocystis murina B123]KTW32916.1 hypothetical protein PNEG_04285 [Pneumocystis murina B123]